MTLRDEQTLATSRAKTETNIQIFSLFTDMYNKNKEYWEEPQQAIITYSTARNQNYKHVATVARPNLEINGTRAKQISSRKSDSQLANYSKLNYSVGSEDGDVFLNSQDLGPNAIPTPSVRSVHKSGQSRKSTNLTPADYDPFKNSKAKLIMDADYSEESVLTLSARRWRYLHPLKVP